MNYPKLLGYQKHSCFVRICSVALHEIMATVMLVT